MYGIWCIWVYDMYICKHILSVKSLDFSTAIWKIQPTTDDQRLGACWWSTCKLPASWHALDVGSHTHQIDMYYHETLVGLCCPRHAQRPASAVQREERDDLLKRTYQNTHNCRITSYVTISSWYYVSYEMYAPKHLEAQSSSADFA